MQTSIETITPAIAKVYLNTSEGNRNLKRLKVAAYARDIKAGKWRVNGESIIFDAGGRLVDGHHRLTAVIDSGVPIETVVVRGVDKDAKKTIDMGASRSAGDALTLAGHKNANNLNSVVLAAMSIAAGAPRRARPSIEEVFDFIEQFPEVFKGVNIATSKPFPRCQGILGAVYFIACMNGDEEIAEQFVDVFRTGRPAYDGCAAHAFRERFLRDQMRGDPMSFNDVHVLVVTAWNKFRQRQSVQILRPGPFRIQGWTTPQEKAA